MKKTRSIKKKKSKFVRPMLHWPYKETKRHTWSVRCYFDDLWFWGFIEQAPFHSQYEDWTNLRLKQIRSEQIWRKSNRESHYMFKHDGRRHYQYKASCPPGKQHQHFWMEFRTKYDIGSWEKSSSATLWEKFERYE